MKMKVNDLLTKYEFLSKIQLKNGSEELSKDLKIKVVSMRIEYGKIKREYEQDFQEFAKQTITPEFEELRDKQEKTDKEQKKFDEMVQTFNENYNKYVMDRLNEDREVSDKTITPEDLEELIAVNADTDVTINNIHMTPGDFLENLSIVFN